MKLLVLRAHDSFPSKMLGPQQVLDLCCLLFLNQSSTKVEVTQTDLGSLSGHQILSWSNEPSSSTTLLSTADPTCCSIQVRDLDFDPLTNEIHPSYSLRRPPAPPSRSRTSVWTLQAEPLLNNTNNGTDVEIDYSKYNFPNRIWLIRPSWEVGVKSLAVAPLMVVAVLGNLIVLRVVTKAHLTRNNPVNMFILNMSIADLFTALLFPWIFLISDFYQKFVLGPFICKFEGFVLVSLMLTSVLSLTVISFDRLMAVVFPFKSRMEPRVSRIVIYSIWITAMALSSPLILKRTYMERQWKNFHETFCKEDRKALQLYWLLLIIFLVWIPLSVLVLSYATILIKVKLDTLEKRQKEQQMGGQVRWKSKVIRMLFVVIIVFSVCWIPFTALIFMRNQMTSTSSITLIDGFRTLYFVSHYLMFLNCALNPLIYGLKNDQFRRELSNCLPGWMSRMRRGQRSRIEISVVGRRRKGANQRRVISSPPIVEGGGGGGTKSTSSIFRVPVLARQYYTNIFVSNQYGRDDLGVGIDPKLDGVKKGLDGPGDGLGPNFLYSFQRRNSALLDLGLPTLPQQKLTFTPQII